MKDQYTTLYSSYRWWVPQKFNIADVCCRRWTQTSADARRIAIHTDTPDGQSESWTYAQLHHTVNRFSNGLRRMGIQRGDRVAIVLPQRPEAAVAVLAVLQLGAVCVPLSAHLDASTYEQRLRDSEARVAVVDAVAANRFLPAANHCPMLKQTVGIDLDQDERVLSWRSLLARQDSAFDLALSAASEPAFLLYTSGANAPAKGVVLSHAVLIGNLPGFVCATDWFPQENDRFWTSVEWGLPVGLLLGLLPVLYFGKTMVATAAPHHDGVPFERLKRLNVTVFSTTPRDLKLWTDQNPLPSTDTPSPLRSIVCTDGWLSPRLFDKVVQRCGIQPNVLYGKVEIGAVAGTCHAQWPSPPGTLGKPYPGHQLRLVDGQQRPVGVDQIGEIVINRYDEFGHADPAFYSNYWRGEETGRPATEAWHHTGDLARYDENGFLWYVGRMDEAFALNGLVATPEQIEEALAEHPQVSAAAVLPLSQGQHLKAYLVFKQLPESMPNPDWREALTQELNQFLAQRLPPALIPCEYEFVGALPLTANGKIRRSLLWKISAERHRPPLVQAPQAPHP